MTEASKAGHDATPPSGSPNTPGEDHSVVLDDTLFKDDDEDDEAATDSPWAKYEALKNKATTLSAVEMDALAQWKWLNGRLGESIDGYLELARLYPKYLHVHFKLGYLYLILQNYESAVQHLTLEIEKLAQIPPLTNVRRVKVLAQKAYFWCSVEGRKEAYHYLKNTEACHKHALDSLLATSDGGSTAEALVAMGCLYRQLGLLQRAEACFDQSSQLKPNDPNYLVEYGKLLLLQRRPGPALAKFSDCRRVAPALSEELFQAMIGEATASMRLNKATVAQGIFQKVIDSLSPMVAQGLAPLLLNSEMDRLTIRQLLYQAINCQGDIKAALDIYYTVVHEFADFQLPVMCVTPGARDAKGQVVDTGMFSTERIVDLLLYLDEIEFRYGPDACLYFHRSNIYRALGDLRHFIDDLILVETLDSNFLRNYFVHDGLGDFLDEETMTWIPLQLLESICELTKPHIPAPTNTLIEAAVYQYFETRLQYNPSDFHAKVFSIDSLRRLNAREELPLAVHRLRNGSGISFDDSLCHLHRGESEPSTARSLIDAMLVQRPSHAMVRFVAGLVYMSELRLDGAHHHFTQCIQEINKTLSHLDAEMQTQGQDATTVTDSLARWTYQGLLRAKYHALVWRSVVLRLNMHSSESVGDMRTAMTLMPDEPHAMFLKGVMMVHYGHLDRSLRPLHDGLQHLRQTGQSKNATVGVDYMCYAGMNVFSLLPHELRPGEGSRGETGGDEEAARRRKNQTTDDLRGSTVLYANALDKMYEAGVLRLAKGQVHRALDWWHDVRFKIGGALKYFESIVSIKPTYVSPAIDAMLELHKCKDARIIDERVFACHQQLSHRAVRFKVMYNLPLEAYKDLTACVAYYAHDIDAYWHRAHLHKQLHNYDAAIEDFSQCIGLSRHAGKAKGTALKRYQKMLLARATAYMEEKKWELALDDFNEVLQFALRETSHVDTAYLIHVYEKRSKVLVALRQYDAAIVEMETVLTLSKDHMEWNDNTLLNMLLLANMHCHAAIETQKRHHSGTYTTFLFPIKENPLTPASVKSLRKAEVYYLQVLERKPSFPLALFLKGRMHALMGDHAQALDLWTKCLRQDPKFLVANFLKGSIRAQQCLPELALAEFLTIRNQIPAYPHVQASIGYCYYLQGNIRRAVVELTEALVHDPKDTMAMFTRGACLQELLSLRNAIADFGATVALQPTHWRAWYQRGMCHLLLKDYTNALFDLGKAAPHLKEGHAAMGYIYFCRHQYSDAIGAYSRFLDERSNDALILLYRGFSMYKHQERSLAMRDFEKALKVDPGCWFAHFIKAYIYQEEGDGEKAMASISKCIDQFKNVRPFAELIQPPTNPDMANPFFGYRLHATLDRLKGLAIQPPSDETLATSLAPKAAPSASTIAKRQALRAIFVRAVRRILFQARVVCALEKFAFKATAASSSLSKQMDVLTELQVIDAPVGESYRWRFSQRMTVGGLIGTFTPDSVAWAYNLMGVLSASRLKWDDALKNFTLAIRAAPSKPIPHLNRGNVYVQVNSLDKGMSSLCAWNLSYDVAAPALNEFRDALKVDPTHAATMTNFALVLRQMSLLEESCRHLYNASSVVLDETHQTHHELVYFALGNVVRELNRNEEALEWSGYAKALAGHAPTADDVAVYHNRGATLHLQSKTVLALADYSTALNLQPSSFETRFNRAQLYLTSSKCHQAMEDLKIATAVHHGHALATRLLRFCERWSCALRLACHDFLYAYQAFPCFHELDTTSTVPMWDPHTFRMQHLCQPDHPAIDGMPSSVFVVRLTPNPVLEKMLDDSKTDEYDFVMRDAFFATQNGDYEEAQRALLTAKYLRGTTDEEEQVCLVWSAQIDLHLGNVTSALESLRQAVRDRGNINPNVDDDDTLLPRDQRLTTDAIEAQDSIRSDLFGYIGCLLRQEGRLEEAIAAFQSSLAHNPTNIYSLFNAASIYLQQEDYSSMLEILLQIINVVVPALDASLKFKTPSSFSVLPPAVNPGLLYAPREFSTLLPRVSLLLTPEIVQICHAIHSTLTEYKNCLSCQVAKYIPQLCVLQGKLAVHVEALRDAVLRRHMESNADVSKPSAAVSPSSSHRHPSMSAGGSSITALPPMLRKQSTRKGMKARMSMRRIWHPDDIKAMDLVEFNKAITKCTEELLAQEAASDGAMTEYVVQYDRVCAHIDASLGNNGDTRGGKSSRSLLASAASSKTSLAHNVSRSSFRRNSSSADATAYLKGMMENDASTSKLSTTSSRSRLRISNSKQSLHHQTLHEDEGN
ncbi:Aste57867_24177 [Aphanomyces stellatus]|uniref:Aste57867_24177 protein n=1 Tax=Aphanomyces stellatus TaxID=120398 RepID=A0A485LU24_9STRA|nr:hypothetical protein As57867_024103 [Aphanomyces stellatus]VFU00819.1 Aste57867_24177 [Aphanomyces stellatus]